MTGPEDKRPVRTGVLVVGAVALAVVAYSAASGRRTETDVPAQAVGWHSAMELYRNVALWAGKRAMVAELNYWKAVA